MGVGIGGFEGAGWRLRGECVCGLDELTWVSLSVFVSIPCAFGVFLFLVLLGRRAGMVHIWNWLVNRRGGMAGCGVFFFG